MFSEIISELIPALEATELGTEVTEVRPTKRGIRDLFLFLSSLLDAEGLLGVEVVVDGLVEWHPTNTGILDSDVDFIILLGRGVM